MHPRSSALLEQPLLGDFRDLNQEGGEKEHCAEWVRHQRGKSWWHESQQTSAVFLQGVGRHPEYLQQVGLNKAFGCMRYTSFAGSQGVCPPWVMCDSLEQEEKLSGKSDFKETYWNRHREELSSFFSCELAFQLAVFNCLSNGQSSQSETKAVWLPPSQQMFPFCCNSNIQKYELFIYLLPLKGYSKGKGLACHKPGNNAVKKAGLKSGGDISLAKWGLQQVLMGALLSLTVAMWACSFYQ